ncbi:hypothetical protein J2S06_001290 [Bacillus alveayuensis]|uniref:Uncharacterized protein n=1 Tax=Aeribacillus alveayuensis TaxID=279215 RepID=A0ABT9VMU8_9BACI|nr:hypothetical protein [Bacillus alveayuensis]
MSEELWNDYLGDTAKTAVEMAYQAILPSIKIEKIDK